MKKIISLLLVLISLTSLTACLNQQKKQVEEVIELIEQLPIEITLSDEQDIELIQNKFDSLTIEEQAKVTNYQKLVNANEQLQILKAQEAAKKKALIVDNLIKALPKLTDLKLSDQSELESVRNAYNDLTIEEQSYVTLLSTLEQLETKMDDLIKENQIYEEGMVVVNLIAALPSSTNLTLDDEANVVATRNAYNALSEDAKGYVNNLDILISLEQRINTLKQIAIDQKEAQIVIDLINELPSLNSLTISDEAVILNALENYNKLTSTQKTYVTNYAQLEALIEELNKLLNEKTYSVYFNLNGGFMDGLTEEISKQTILAFNVNQYSVNFFQDYETDIFVYKTAFLTNSTYKYAYKIGFSYNPTTKAYVVDQIIPDENELNSIDRISEYYLFVHNSNTDALEQVKIINLGQYLSFDGDLPDNPTSSLNMKCTVYEVGDLAYFKTYRGINTLEIPTRDGYEFVGWYLTSDFSGKQITEVNDTVTVYAKWVISKVEITTSTILNCVSDIVTSDTIDNLILKNDDATFTWSSSDNRLYTITDNTGRTSRLYQTHQTQKVIVSVEIKYNNGDIITLSKEIIIAPVLYSNITTTPVATYFYTGAISAYQQYNERYLKDRTLFSANTKETLDIVYYAFIVPKADGSVSIQNTAYLDQVKELKNHNVRILGCVNGVSSETSSAFKTITADATLRKTFINNLMDLVEKYNLDGLDIDWEAINSTIEPVASQVNALISELREEMNNRQAEGGTPYLITMAVPASSYGTATDRFDFKTLNKYVDYINIMSYDMNKTDITTHLSPLYKSQKDNGYGFGCDYGVNRLVSLGMSKEKLIIGSAGYGKAYKVTGTISETYPGLGVAGTLTKIDGINGSFASGTLYGSAINILIKSGNYVQYTETNSKGQVVGSYLYNSTDRIFITYDSSEAITAKYNYAAANPGVGIMCWAYTEDTADIVIDAITAAKKAIYQ